MLATALLALFGTAVGVYMTVVQAAGATAVCFGSSGCGVVAASSYATLLGVPVALLGALTFAGIAAAALLGYGRPRTAGRSVALAIFAMAVGGAAYSAYLTAISGVVLGAYCPWCLVSAGTMLMILLLALRGVRVR